MSTSLPHSNWIDRSNFPTISEQFQSLQNVNQDVIIGGVQHDLTVLNLHTILLHLGHVPRYTAFLGICSDGVPLLMDMANPNPGSILVLGQRRIETTHMLNTLLSSTSELNSPDYVKYFVISNNAHEFRYLSHYSHCQGIYSHFHTETAKIILGLSALVEQRRLGRERGPAVILVMDELADFTGEYMDYDLFVHLKWLLRFGPSAFVWPIVSVNHNDLQTIDRELIDIFSTKLISPRTDDIERHTSQVSELHHPKAWQAIFDRELIPFHLPSL